MITIRNPTYCHSRTAIAGEAMKVGMVVKLVQADAIGDPCKVMKAAAADLGDPTIVKGLVYYRPDTDEAVDYTVNPATGVLTLNTGADNTTDIPSGAMVTFWHGKPVVGFDQHSVDATHIADVKTVREGTKVAFDGDTSLLATYLAGQTDGREDFMGVVYQNDGVEITVIFTEL